MKNLKIIFNVGLVLLLAVSLIEAINIYGIKNRTLSIGNIDGCSFIELRGTNSMLPTIKEGDWICFVDYNKYKEKNKLKIGDIITFKYKDERITHRIIKINDKWIITKGDNNKMEDEPINYNQVLNVVQVIIIK
jgi:signal peptidase I